jgi:hypothetical protein
MCLLTFDFVLFSPALIMRQNQINQIFERNKNMVAPIMDPPYATWGAGEVVQVQSCWKLDDPVATTTCIDEVQRHALDNQPRKPIPRPKPPRKHLGFWENIGCNIKRGACILGCTIYNAALTLAQKILSAAQGILKAIRYVLNKVTEVLDSLSKNIEIRVSFGASLSTQQFSFSLGFFMKFYPIKFNFNLTIRLNLSSLGDLFKAMLSQVWNWFLNKVGLGGLKTAAEKNPAIRGEFGRL